MVGASIQINQSDSTEKWKKRGRLMYARIDHSPFPPLALSLLVLLFPACCLADEDRPEIAGLRSSITKITREKANSITLSYKLAWTDNKREWLIKEIEPVYVQYRDAGGRILGDPIHQIIGISDRFARKKVSADTSEIKVTVPEGAAHVEVRFGKSN